MSSAIIVTLIQCSGPKATEMLDHPIPSPPPKVTLEVLVHGDTYLLHR